LSREEWQAVSPHFESDVSAAFDARRSIVRKKTTGSTNPDMVRRQMDQARALLRSAVPRPDGSGTAPF